MIIERWVPLIGWLRTYHRGLLTRDVLAAVIVTLMLVPQALAYAMLAGLPPEMGLYASMLPLVLYAIFGTSASLAVGPVAVAALMTASALSSFAAPGSPEYIGAALVLAAAFEAAVPERLNLASMRPQVFEVEAPDALVVEVALFVLVQRLPHLLRFQHSLVQPTK